MEGFDFRVLFTYRLLIGAGYLDDDLFGADEDSTPHPLDRIAVDPDQCTGCYACRGACPASAIHIWDNQVRVTNPLACPPCAEAPCISSCPTGALSDRESGPSRPRLH